MSGHSWTKKILGEGKWEIWECDTCGYRTTEPVPPGTEPPKDTPVWRGEFFCEDYIVWSVQSS